MPGSASGFEFIEIPRPGKGHRLAHEAAALLLQGIQGIQTPGEEEIMDTIAREMDDNLSLAAVNHESSVIGTGGIVLFGAGDVLVGAIVNVVVAPGEQRSGLGTGIMAELEKCAKRAGVQELFGQPEPGTEKFYERLGYQPAQRPYMQGSGLAKLL